MVVLRRCHGRNFVVDWISAPFDLEACSCSICLSSALKGALGGRGPGEGVITPSCQTGTQHGT